MNHRHNPHPPLEREQTPAKKVIGLLALFTLSVIGFTAIGIVLGF